VGKWGRGGEYTIDEFGGAEEFPYSAKVLRDVPGAVADLIMVLDWKGRCLAFESGCVAFSQKRMGDPVGKTLREVLPERQAEEHLRYVGRSLGMREVLEVEYDLEVAGQKRRFAGTVSPLAAGTVSWAARDITERRKIEPDPRETDVRYRKLVEQAPLVMYTENTGSPTEVTYVSPQVQAIFGHSPEEFAKDKSLWMDSVHPEDRERVLAADERADRTGDPFLMEYRVTTKDGRAIWVREQTSLVRDSEGQPSHWQGFMWDITDRKEAEQALKENEAKYRSLVEQLPALIYVEAIDEGESETDFVYISPQHEELLGYSAEEWTSDNKFWEKLIHPDDRERILAEDARTDETGEPFRVEYRYIARDGSTVWVRDDAVLVRDDGGAPLFWQGVMFDITESKRTEEKIQLLNEELEERVAERTARLQAYAERLAASNRELEDFAYVASHDLQEPLRKVLAFGERLKSKYADALGEQGLDYLRRMEAATVRMQDLIEDLLSLSRVTTRAHPFEPVDFGEIAREVLADLEARLEETEGTVEVGELPTIDADRGQIRQLLQNLVGNALKFRKETEPPVVKVYGRVEDREEDAAVCRLVVEDNGIGFDERYLSRIFAPFERLHGRAAYEGTGMGLAICRKVVERHGGEITARSLPGEGSTFVVTLPAEQ
jgi:PAS domain S-box-containing protein